MHGGVVATMVADGVEGMADGVEGMEVTIRDIRTTRDITAATTGPIMVDTMAAIVATVAVGAGDA
jgi:hypothetical protein